MLFKYSIRVLLKVKGTSEKNSLKVLSLNK